MGALLRFLVSLAAHTAWQRMGQRGPVPPVRLKGRTTRLPMIAPWQMMVASWVISKLWITFGHDVKHRLKTARHPAAKRVGDLLPTPPNPPNSPSTSQSGPSPASAPNHPSQSASQSTQPPVPPPKPNYDTQVLDSADTQNANQANLPQGSVLSGLRDSTT